MVIHLAADEHFVHYTNVFASKPIAHAVSKLFMQKSQGTLYSVIKDALCFSLSRGLAGDLFEILAMAAIQDGFARQKKFSFRNLKSNAEIQCPISYFVNSPSNCPPESQTLLSMHDQQADSAESKDEAVSLVRSFDQLAIFDEPKPVLYRQRADSGESKDEAVSLLRSFDRLAIFDQLDEVQKCPVGHMAIPSWRSLKSVDCLVVPNVVFQVTVTSEHAVDLSGVTAALGVADRGTNAPPVLIFVVPDEPGHEFGLQSFKVSACRHKRKTRRAYAESGASSAAGNSFSATDASATSGVAASSSSSSSCKISPSCTTAEPLFTGMFFARFRFGGLFCLWSHCFPFLGATSHYNAGLRFFSVGSKLSKTKAELKSLVQAHGGTWSNSKLKPPGLFSVG